MEITIEQRDAGYLAVQLRGELRREAGEQVEEQLHALIAPRDSAMIVDLSGVTAIDSSGLNQLISLATHARMCGSQLVLFGPTPFVAGVLEITKLDKWFDVAEDEPAAVGRLQEKQE